jgi:4-amino-4-deoxy-L-arabinose transferase-like glycosyltransferase
MKKGVLVLLTVIVLLGGWLRFRQLANHPVSLSIDEVAIGYNAYSILKTARDEHGEFLPLAFRSVGDYKPPILIYLTVPSIAVFGLNEFGVRFPVALIGTLTIIFVYLLTYQLTKNKIVSLATSFSIAISPWHIQFSRATFEAILALFFMLVGVWLFLRSMEKRDNLLWLSAIFFPLAMYSYHAERLTVPILVMGLALIFRKELWRYKKNTLTAVVVGLVFSLPLFYLLLSPAGQARLTSTFISKDFLISFQLHQSGAQLNLIQKILDNNPLILINFWLKRYLDYWDLRFLFFKGVKLTLPNFPDVGLFHLVEIIPFLIGIWLVFLNKKILAGKQKAVVVFWLLIGPLAASLANNEQHALRSLTAIPAPQILVGAGVFWLFNWLKKKAFIKKVVFGFLISVVVISSLIYYMDIYYLHFPIHYSEFWDYGMKDAVSYAWENKDQYDEIIIDPVFGTEGPYTFGTPYLYVLFYGKYDPYLFQNSPRRWTSAGESVNFDKFTFRAIYWPTDRQKKGALFIGSPWSLSLDELLPGQILKTIPFKNGATGFLIVETENSER